MALGEPLELDEGGAADVLVYGGVVGAWGGGVRGVHGGFRGWFFGVL